MIDEPEYAEMLADLRRRLEAEKRAIGWAPPEAQGANGRPAIRRDKPVNQGGKVVRTREEWYQDKSLGH